MNFIFAKTIFYLSVALVRKIIVISLHHRAIPSVSYNKVSSTKYVILGRNSLTLQKCLSPKSLSDWLPNFFESTPLPYKDTITLVIKRNILVSYYFHLISIPLSKLRPYSTGNYTQLVVTFSFKRRNGCYTYIYIYIYIKGGPVNGDTHYSRTYQKLKKGRGEINNNRINQQHQSSLCPGHPCRRNSIVIGLYLNPDDVGGRVWPQLSLQCLHLGDLGGGGWRGVFYINNNIAEVLGSLLLFNLQKPQKSIHFWKEEILSFNILHKNIEYQLHRKYEKSWKIKKWREIMANSNL